LRGCFGDGFKKSVVLDKTLTSPDPRLALSLYRTMDSNVADSEVLHGTLNLHPERAGDGSLPLEAN
jgi:hypothetical protein